MLRARGKGFLSDVPNVYNPFFISRLRELLDCEIYELILDGIFLDKLHLDGINYGSVQMMQHMLNMSRAWREEW